MIFVDAFNLRVLGAAVRERLLQGPKVVKGDLVHHLQRPGQLHLSDPNQIIQVKPW